MPPATQAELARRLGLSRSTIAAALNPKSTVKLRQATVDSILQEAARLDYRPNLHAQLIRGGRSGTIGIFHYGGLSQVAAERAWHAARAIQKVGYRLLSVDLSWSPGGARAGCEIMLDAKVEGVIVAGLNDPASVSELAEIKKNRIPLITLSGNSLKGVPHVRGDAQTAMHHLTNHLIRLGRRRLILLAHHSEIIQPGSYLWAFTERRKGFTAALTEAKGEVVEDFSSRRGSRIQGKVVTSSLVSDPFDPYAVGRQLMEEILKAPILPDAVLCGNDEWAFGAMAACSSAGIGIPEQIAITGYDNNSFGQYLDVPLTTIAQPSQLMADYAVNRLLAILSAPKRTTFTGVKLFPCQLVIRKSCGAS